MSIMKVDYGEVGGGEVEVEYYELAYTAKTIVTVPTTKKAKALVYFVVASPQYLFQVVDGVNGNIPIRNSDPAASGVKFIFNDNNITTDTWLSQNNQTLRMAIIYG